MSLAFLFPGQGSQAVGMGAALTFVLVGSNPLVSHGHSNAMPDPIVRLREHQARGGALWVIDPRRTETARLADHHLAPVPSTDHLVLAYVVRELLRDGADRARAVSAACVEVADAVRIVGEGAVQIHGAMGLTEELSLGAHFKRALAIAAAFGSRADHLARYAEAAA